MLRAPKRDTDTLFVLTQRHDFFFLTWDVALSRLNTVASGNALEPIGRPVDTTPLAVIDPHKRCVAIHSYSGLLRIVALDAATGGVIKHFTVRTEDLSLLDMRFEERGAAEPPMLTVLHHDPNSTARRCAPNLRYYAFATVARVATASSALRRIQVNCSACR